MTDSKIARLEKIKEKCIICQKCDLGKTRTNTVFSDGNPEAPMMIIGEAPGKNEDETGIPFVGRAGKLLDKILHSQNITRENDVYICNMVKSRPPENRVPTPHEIAMCKEYLDAQIDIVRPQIILLVGSTSAHSILGIKTPISKIRGQWFDGPYGSKMMPIFHPSYLLRYEHKKDAGSPMDLMNQDIVNIRKALDEVYSLRS